MSPLPSRLSNLRREGNGPLLAASQLRTWWSTQHHAVDDSTMLTDLGAEGTGLGVGNRNMCLMTDGLSPYKKTPALEAKPVQDLSQPELASVKRPMQESGELVPPLS